MSSGEYLVSPLTAIELECADPRRPVDDASVRVILVGVPECAIIHRVNRHGTVISPAAERIDLHAAAIHQDQRP